MHLFPILILLESGCMHFLPNSHYHTQTLTIMLMPQNIERRGGTSYHKVLTDWSERCTHQAGIMLT